MKKINKTDSLLNDGTLRVEEYEFRPIDKNGDVILNGMNLFDPRQPFWRWKAPDLKYPE